MSKKLKTVPDLRFSGFACEWKTKPAGELCDCVVPGRNKPEDFTGEIPWITTPDFRHNEEIKVSKSGLAISREEAKRVGSKIVVKDSVVISCVGELGLVAITANDVVINQQLHAFLPCETVTPRFLLYSLSMRTRYMDRVATKTAVPYMNKENCNSIPVIYPTLPEQRKIADFLTAVDGRIQQLSQKKALLEDYKKGVMQQLFTQALRFKDDHGNEFPDWEEKKLTDVLETVSPRGFQIQSSEILPEGRFKVVDQGKALIAGYCDDSTRVMRARPVVVYGDHTTIIKYVDFEFVVGADGTQILVSKDSQSDLKYLYYNLVQNNVTQEGYKRHFSILKGVFLQIPSPPEQTKIANFLTALDRKIESVAQQITHTQAFKKGLLQQMFV